MFNWFFVSEHWVDTSRIAPVLGEVRGVSLFGCTMQVMALFTMVTATQLLLWSLQSLTLWEYDGSV
jgi:hypothetical protein